ncbi:MAG: phosphoribosylformylglycinamidine cyclo-ligase, partial [Emcibacter sp.]|nr:phosphoribosylformylglycinamidine cyclo-ligase [Emcibacter sp.]
MANDKKSYSYKEAGVDIEAGNDLVEAIKPAAASTKRPGCTSGLGGFGALFDLKAAGYTDPILVSGTDGVGTKLKVAIESGQHGTVGIDLVAMCVNDLIVQGAEPLFFLDYFATGHLSVEAGRAIIEGIAEGCRQSGAALIGGETAEMPGMYAPGHYDIGGFCVGVVDRPKMVDGSKITAGDVIIGLASNGPHSNGFSMVRRLLELGKADLNNDILSDGRKAVEGVLSPTRLYVPAVNALMQSGAEIHGFSHITGGGMFDNFERLLTDELAVTIDVSAWPVPPAFEYLLGFADVARDERYRTFNMGIGFAVILSESEVDKVEAVLKEA